MMSSVGVRSEASPLQVVRFTSASFRVENFPPFPIVGVLWRIATMQKETALFPVGAGSMDMAAAGFQSLSCYLFRF